MKNNKILIGCLVGLLILITFLLTTKKPKTKKTNSDICRGYLTDNEYLEHMIPHHQVAVDISILLQKKNKKSGYAGHIKKDNMGSKLRNT